MPSLPIKVIAICLAVLAVAALSHAQIKQEDLAETGPRNEEVQEATSWERVDDDLIYLRPSVSFDPDGDLEIELPEKPKDPEQQLEDIKWNWVLILGVIIGAIILIFILKGSRIQVGFDRKKTGKATDGPTMADDEIVLGDVSGFLDRLAAMADRREALILLVSRALERAAHANAMTLGRAQTGRDVVRALPQAWRHRETLRDLVRQAEVVHFGGRDISEERWQECLTAARPLFRGMA